MTEEELKDSFSKLTLEAERVMNSNDEVEIGLIAQLEAGLDTEDEELTEQQKADITKTANECESKLKETKALLQTTLWDDFGHVELTTAFQVAETECERAAAIHPDGNQEAYDFILTHLKDVAKSAYIAQLAMRETANLPAFAHLKEERDVMFMWTTYSSPTTALCSYGL